MPDRPNGTTSEYREIIDRLKALQVDGTAPRLAAIDPTLNVIQLVAAETKRQDDLRTAESKHRDDLMNQREKHDLRLAEAQDKLLVAEAKRIDAIRAVDVGAVAIASERASQQAAVLANQVSASAETLRALVASTAATVAQQLSQVSGQLVERISLLEKSQYEIRGGAGTPPPWHTETMARISLLEAGRERVEGKGEGMAKFAGWIAAALMALIGLLPTILRLMK
jgi:hypothetical protein